MVEPRQLSLLKGRRQRGTAPPTPKESELHTQLVYLIDTWPAPGSTWKYTHIASGEKRDIVTAARLKRMGVKRGWPDFIFVERARRQVFFLELKRKGEKPSDEQVIISNHLMHSGCGYCCTDSFADAVSILKNIGVLRATVSA